MLPWRARPGQRADPYRVWLSEIILQQTTVKAVAPYFERFLSRFPDLQALAAAPLEDVLKAWAGLGYYARGRNLHACAKVLVADYGGMFPNSESALRKLPGIGAYTASAVAAIAFDQKATPVDGNCERVIARLFAVEEAVPKGKRLIGSLAEQLTPSLRPGDFAQAIMDLGAMICTPKKPACVVCPWAQSCAARRAGDPERFPVKSPKVGGQLRRGAAFVLVRGGQDVLVRTRPSNGLLGGMTEVPGSDWTHTFQKRDALKSAPLELTSQWREARGTVTHTFTHFPLELHVYTAEAPIEAAPPSGMRFVKLSDMKGEAFPSLMRKVIAHALEAEIIHVDDRRKQ